MLGPLSYTNSFLLHNSHSWLVQAGRQRFRALCTPSQDLSTHLQKPVSSTLPPSGYHAVRGCSFWKNGERRTSVGPLLQFCRRLRGHRAHPSWRSALCSVEQEPGDPGLEFCLCHQRAEDLWTSFLISLGLSPVGLAVPDPRIL